MAAGAEEPPQAANARTMVRASAAASSRFIVCIQIIPFLFSAEISSGRTGGSACRTPGAAGRFFRAAAVPKRVGQAAHKMADAILQVAKKAGGGLPAAGRTGGKDAMGENEFSNVYLFKKPGVSDDNGNSLSQVVL